MTFNKQTICMQVVKEWPSGWVRLKSPSGWMILTKSPNLLRRYTAGNADMAEVNPKDMQKQLQPDDIKPEFQEALLKLNGHKAY